MKHFIVLALLATTAAHLNAEGETKPLETKPAEVKPIPVDPALHPTGLTVVLMDADNKVLDTVKVPDDKKHYQITFSTGDDHQKIKVFALGPRIYKEIPKGVYTTGLAKKEGGGGLGRVEATIEGGELVTFTGNGYGTFALTEAISTAIAADLKEDKPADLTTMDELVEDESEDAE